MVFPPYIHFISSVSFSLFLLFSPFVFIFTRKISSSFANQWICVCTIALNSNSWTKCSHTKRNCMQIRIEIDSLKWNERWARKNALQWPNMCDSELLWKSARKIYLYYSLLVSALHKFEFCIFHIFPLVVYSSGFGLFLLPIVIQASVELMVLRMYFIGSSVFICLRCIVIFFFFRAFRFSETTPVNYTIHFTANTFFWCE